MIPMDVPSPRDAASAVSGLFIRDKHEYQPFQQFQFAQFQLFKTLGRAWGLQPVGQIAGEMALSCEAGRG
jgi:hypothetical protein